MNIIINMLCLFFASYVGHL